MGVEAREIRNVLRSFLVLLSGASVLLHLLCWWQLLEGRPVAFDVLAGLLAGPIVCLSGQASYRAEPARPLLARICGGALLLNLVSLAALLLSGNLRSLYS